ncbi:MAG: phosphatidate cytidylyltransferase [Porphyrobacter sp.]|nr:phosphatidate cytidylyltransferase [Porphyrobacter sp.]
MVGGKVRVRDPKAGVSDLPVRLGSAVVMLVVSAGALWLGGWVWTGFVALLGLGVLWEWNRLVARFNVSGAAETAWFFAGVIYIGAAALAMAALRNGAQFLPVEGQSLGYGPLEVLIGYIAPIIAVDAGAYFAGRAIGGPKIAPRISPSKTWAGLGGGALAAGLVTLGTGWAGLGPASAMSRDAAGLALALFGGALVAVIAQTGDFFESWMKRRAGVKDSSALIPGHGGLFDRLDGFIAVFFMLFVVALGVRLLG